MDLSPPDAILVASFACIHRVLVQAYAGDAAALAVAQVLSGAAWLRFVSPLKRTGNHCWAHTHFGMVLLLHCRPRISAASTCTAATAMTLRP